MSRMGITNGHMLEPLRDWTGPLMNKTDEVVSEVTEHNPDGITNTVRKRSITWRIGFDLFCLAWIVPIVILLTLNFKSWIVGAGVGCRLKGLQNDCFIDLLDPDGNGKAEMLDKKDHELLGALQFVAKALEVWFGIIVTSLVYDLTILLAIKGDGLPVGYLMTHAEFGDILTLFEHSFWTTASPLRLGRHWQRGRRLQLFAFVLFVASLCIACNLMGPATAVLVLPSLGWSEISHSTAQKFGEMAASESPRNPKLASGCDASALVAGNFTCSSMYSVSLDEQSAGLAWRFEEAQMGWAAIPGVSEDFGLSFTYNTSSQYDTIWVPNRYVLRDVSADYVEYQYSQEDKTFKSASSEFATIFPDRTLDPNLRNPYRNALDVTLRRRGPSIGLSTGCARANFTELILSSTQSVRCYFLNASLDSSQTDCIRIGSGWNEDGFAHSEFLIGDADPRSAGSVSVDVYSVTRAVTLNETTLPCLSTTQNSQPCNWDLLFSTDPAPIMRNDSFDLQYTEYTLPLLSAPNATIVCKNFAYLTFAEYAVEISPSINTLGLVTLGVPSYDPQNTLRMHSDWTLAAWSVARAGTVDARRATGMNLVSTLKRVADTTPPATFDEEDVPLELFFLQHLIVSLHATSLVDFTTTKATDASAKKNDDPLHPMLTVSQSLRVWAFGHGTHTFILGTVISIFGCACVLLRMAIGHYFTSRRQSTLKLLAAAMKYQHEGELDGLEKESEVAQVMVRMRHDDTGKIAFLPPQKGLARAETRYRPGFL